jgi:EAL domain-containing protein (putative c-di-GMP-specific phosphodiesterase class I)
LRAALTQSGVDARRIGVELTESLLIDPQQMGDVLQEISVLGVQLALDDFGTGFSSLSYLRRFPIDILKIDQSFVSNADTDEDDAEMVKTIIGMAHNLRMKLVAEGVETARQAELLTEQGCEVAQGYHFSRPLTVTDFEALLRRQSGQ